MTDIAPPPAPPQPGPPTAPRNNALRLTLIIGITALVGLLVLGGLAAAFLPFAFRAPVNQRLSVAAGSSVEVDVRDASFEFAPSTDGRVRVAITGWAAVPPSVTARTAQDRTTVEGGCSVRILFSPCDLHLAVTMPADADLTVTGTNGGITVRDIRGAIDAGTTNGTVDVRNASGSVQMNSTNGELRLGGASASRVRAETTNGAIDLAFTSAPTSVDARSTNGAVTVVVPDTGPYSVSAHTTNGPVDTSSIRTDPSAPSRITVETTNGAVRVLPR